MPSSQRPPPRALQQQPARDSDPQQQRGGHAMERADAQADAEARNLDEAEREPRAGSKRER